MTYYSTRQEARHDKFTVTLGNTMSSHSLISSANCIALQTHNGVGVAAIRGVANLSAIKLG